MFNHQFTTFCGRDSEINRLFKQTVPPLLSVGSCLEYVEMFSVFSHKLLCLADVK